MCSAKCKSWISEIAPYQPGESKLGDVERVIKLSSNESALGPSPSVLTAIQDEASNIVRYADPQSSKLRTAISQVYDLNRDWIILVSYLAFCLNYRRIPIKLF